MLDLSRHTATLLAMLLAAGTLILVLVLLGYLAYTVPHAPGEDR